MEEHRNRYHFTQDQIAVGFLKLVHVPVCLQLTDIFIKLVGASILRFAHCKLGLQEDRN